MFFAYCFALLYDVCRATWFDVANVEVERVIPVDLHCFESEVLLICDVRIAVHELWHYYLMPVLLVMFFHFLCYHIFLIKV